MTQPQTATDVALHLAQLSRQLDATVRDLAALDEAAVRARARYTSEYARAFLTAEGSMDIRKQQAVLEVAEQALDADIADAKVRACKESIRTISTRIDVGRSYGAAVRAEIGLAQVGGAA